MNNLFMRNSYKSVLIAGYFLLLITRLNNPVSAQGRLVRGIEKAEFTLKGTTADFYVSPSGNDNWSGTLANPNQSLTDGPFATIDRA